MSKANEGMEELMMMIPEQKGLIRTITQQINTLFTPRIRTTSPVEFLRAGQSLIDDL